MLAEQAAPYDPYAHLASAWPGWTLTFTSLHGLAGELFDVPNRTIRLEPARGRRDYLAAHAIAHLCLGHHLSLPGRFFTAKQESDASAMARIRLMSNAELLLGSVHREPVRRQSGPADLIAHMKGARHREADPPWPDFGEGYCPSLRTYLDGIGDAA